MEQFVGLDISQAMTHVCVVDGKGKKAWQGKCHTNPEEIAMTIRAKAPAASLIGLESGALSPWLWRALKGMGLPAVCVDARHAHGALSMQINKTDANDAHGIAQMMRTSFFKEVTVKSLDSHRIRTVLGARAQLVGIRTALKNQIRGVLNPPRLPPAQGWRSKTPFPLPLAASWGPGRILRAVARCGPRTPIRRPTATGRRGSEGVLPLESLVGDSKWLPTLVLRVGVSRSARPRAGSPAASARRTARSTCHWRWGSGRSTRTSLP